MWHEGIDLHRRTLVVAAVNDAGEVRPAVTLSTAATDAVAELFKELKPFRAVIEATGTYRWLHDLLAPIGTVLLAHPLRLRAMIVRRSKSDRLDAHLLAQLLRLDQRVFQSGDTLRSGYISKQGSPWLRWVLVEAAMKLVTKDVKLANFYQRIRKRSSSKIARVAAARKLAEICQKRLRRWQRLHAASAAA